MSATGELVLSGTLQGDLGSPIISGQGGGARFQGGNLGLKVADITLLSLAEGSLTAC